MAKEVGEDTAGCEELDVAIRSWPPTQEEVEGYIRIVLRAAGKESSGRGQDQQSAALWALAKAITRFDPNEGFRFESYLKPFLRGELGRDRRALYLCSTRRAYRIEAHEVSAAPHEQPAMSMDHSFVGDEGDGVCLRDLIQVGEDSGLSDEDQILLRSALGGLDDTQLEFIFMHFWEGRSYEEIAWMKGRPQGQVDKAIRAAKAVLRDRMAGNDS